MESFSGIYSSLFEIRMNSRSGGVFTALSDHIIMKKEEKKIYSKVYSTIYDQCIALRPSCYQCPYKSIQHPGDITIADFWGINEAIPGFNDNRGVSLVMVNTDLGNQIFMQVKDHLEFYETKLEESLQPALRENHSVPKDREQFWKMLLEDDFDSIVHRYIGSE